MAIRRSSVSLAIVLAGLGGGLLTLPLWWRSDSALTKPLEFDAAKRTTSEDQTRTSDIPSSATPQSDRQYLLNVVELGDLETVSNDLMAEFQFQTYKRNPRMERLRRGDRARAAVIIDELRLPFEHVQEIAFVREKTYDERFSHYNHVDHVAFEAPFQVRVEGEGEQVAYTMTTDNIVRQERVSTPGQRYTALRFELDDSQINLFELYVIQDQREFYYTGERVDEMGTRVEVLESPELTLHVAGDPKRVVKAEEYNRFGELIRTYDEIEYEAFKFHYREGGEVLRTAEIQFPVAYVLRGHNPRVQLDVVTQSVTINASAVD